MHKQTDQKAVFEGHVAKTKCEFLPGMLAEATQHEQHNYRSCCIRRCCSINLNASGYAAHNYPLRLTAPRARRGRSGFYLSPSSGLHRGKKKTPAPNSAVPFIWIHKRTPALLKLLNCRNTAGACGYWWPAAIFPSCVFNFKLKCFFYWALSVHFLHRYLLPSRSAARGTSSPQSLLRAAAPGFMGAPCSVPYHCR